MKTIVSHGYFVNDCRHTEVSPFSRKEFSSPSIMQTKDTTCWRNLSRKLLVCLWCKWIVFDCLLLGMFFSNSLTILAICGPQIIQHVNLAVFSLNPIALPSSFSRFLFCSWAWSLGMDEKFHKVFVIQNLSRKFA